MYILLGVFFIYFFFPQPRASGERIVVFERKSGKLVTGPAAPLDATLHSWLVKHPTFEVLQPSQQISTASTYDINRESIKMSSDSVGCFHYIM